MTLYYLVIINIVIMIKSNSFSSSTIILRPHGLFLIVIGILLFLLSGCGEDDLNIDPIPTPEPDNNSIIDQFNTDDDVGVIELDGFKLELMPGAIPNMADGSPATVTFSIETDIDLPQALPAGMEQVGKTVHFGPEGFIFQKPLLIKFPIPESHTPDRVSIIHFDEEAQSWQIVPTGFMDLEKREIGAFVLSLDHFAVVNIEGYNKSMNERLSGGVRWNLSSSVFGPGDCCVQYPPVPMGWHAGTTYIILKVKSFTPKYNYNYSFSNPNRWIGMTPSDIASSISTGAPWHSQGIEMWLPQGTYEFWVMAQRRRSFPGEPSQIETYCYSLPATANINGPVTCDWFGCDGWTSPQLPTGGSWINAQCGEWPDHTIPVCTGEFQATLTWNNSSSEITDLDLHLYGPNDLNVYYQNKTPGTGGIILDRDIIDKVGDVQENICAPTLHDLPSGNYRIAVQHFDGVQKTFQVRLVRGSKSESYSGNISSNTTPVAPNTSKPEITVFEFEL